MKRGLQRLLVATVILACCILPPVCAQAPERQEQQNFVFHFPLSSEVLVKDYKNNAKQLDQILSLLSPNANVRIDSIFFYGCSSPEGSEIPNIKSAAARAAQLRGYLCYRRPTVNKIPYRIYSSVRSWHHIYQDVQADPHCPDKTAVLVLLEYASGTAVLDVLKSTYPRAYEYLLRNMFPTYRNASACVVYFSKIQETPAAFVAPGLQSAGERADQEELEQLTKELEVLKAERLRAEQKSKNNTALLPVSTQTDYKIKPTSFEDLAERKPLFALKTNLLFDAASILNVELEIPIGRRWSFAAEWIAPWWLWDDEQYCLQVMSGTVEARCWLGDRTDRKQLTGWFLGAYASGGLYDLEWKGAGIQGEFFVAAGLSAGFAHTLDKRGTWRMEYSLGVGYMQTNYQEYKAEYGLDKQWHLIHQQSGTYTWIGPTRAKISLVFMIHHGYEKKKGGSL